MLCIVSATVIAQQRFSSTTSLLTLDVSVLDGDGNPVTGLTPDDFVVTVNKSVQSVQTMVFLATRQQVNRSAVTASSSGTEATRTSDAQPEPRREPDPKLLVLLVDDISIYPNDSKGLFVAAERFLDTIPAKDWVGLASTSGRMTVNPSLDRGPLLQTLKRAFGQMNDPRRDSRGFVGFMDALDADASGPSLLHLIEATCKVPLGTKTLAQLLAENQCASDVQPTARNNATFARTNTRNQLDAYMSVIKAMASAPGVKQLVILTGGLALRPIDSLDFVPATKAAAAAGVQITVLMEEPGDDISAPGGWVQDQRRMLQESETFAEMAGGQLFHVVGQADRFFARVLKSASAVYRLGVDLPKEAPPDGQYQLTVSVKRPGVRVLAARYAAPPIPNVAPPPPPPPTAPPAVPAPAPPARAVHDATSVPVLAKAASYLDAYEKAFSVVVSEETYTQELEIQPAASTRTPNVDRTVRRERTLRSDLLQTKIGAAEWVAFRDVYEVDGRPVRDHEARLQKLFVDSPAEGLAQARRIAAESARFNLGVLKRDINVPTMALGFLRGANQSRSSFTVGGRKKVEGIETVALEFTERATPTMIRAADADVPASGTFWIEPDSGRVVKSELTLADRRSTAKITVTYAAVPKLSVWVPVLMLEEYKGPEMIQGRATYEKFRQFGVSVEIK